MKVISLVAAAALPLLALAHFTLDYPYTRGFDENLEPEFCGGFNTPSSSRTPYSLSGSAPLLINSHHPSADVAVLISFDQNPTNFSAFNQTSEGQAYGLLKPFGRINGQGEFCFNVDIASLGVNGLQNGSVATIQVEFNGGDGALFQCSDIVLVSNYSAPSNVTCSNATSSGAPSQTASGSMGGPSQTGSPSSGARRVIVGGIAGAVAAVMGVALAF
ncbi:gpianchored protein [Rhodotorula toruloides]|uniref:Gpianchored protein n=1 Tax=Rhodotorula toruloides TaxID=5286 RepID=A0A511KJ51_RHOTO|nr:gpianchored protein [Rhodotorula toruloides]